MPISPAAYKAGPRNIAWSGTSQPGRWSTSPKWPMTIICLTGLGLFALLLAMNSASLGGRKIIHISCCYDAPSYFSTGHALLFHHSFDLSSEFEAVGQPFEGWSSIVPATGRPASVFAIGYSLLEIPFLALGTGLDALTHHPADGYSTYALTAYYGANILFVTIALLCLYRLLYELGGQLDISQESRVWVPLFVVLAMLPATSLGYYAFSPLPHVAGFMMLSIFFLTWWHIRNSNSWWRWALLGVLGGLTALCRWQDAVYLAAPPLCELLHLYKTHRIPENASVAKWLGVRSLYCCMGLLTLTPQLIEWKAIFGHYLLVPQGPGFFQFPPRFVPQVLFSTQHGWFLWTPVTLLCIIGLLMAWNRLEGYLAPWALILFAEIALMGAQPTDWHGYESFSIRSLTCSLAVAGVGLAMFLWLMPKKVLPLLCVVVAFCALYSTVFAAQYRLDLIPKNDRLLSRELIHDKLYMRQAYARSRSAQRGEALIKKGDAAGATVSLNKSLVQYGDDRTLLKALAEAYAADGNTAAAEETRERLAKLLDKRLF